MAFYPNSSIVGADFNSTNTTQQFALGTTAMGSANTEWVYVYMSGAASAGNCVVVSQTGTAAAASIALAIAPGNHLAFAQSAFTAADYGWVAKKGAITVEMSATTAAITTALYVGTVAGHLSTTVGSATVYGVQVAGSSATATAWTATGTVTWPRIGNANLSDS